MINNIIYSSSDDYAMCTGISIYSLLHNNNHLNSINIYVISDKISTENKGKIKQVCFEHNVRLEFIEIQSFLTELRNNQNTKELRGSYSTYSKILLADIFREIDQVLFIDSDTLITGELSPLLNIELGDKIIAAAPDFGVYYKDNSYEEKHIIYKNEFYFNAGVIVIDLDKWRKQNISKKILKLINESDNYFKAAEQSILNYLIGDQVKKIELRYNYYTALHRVSVRTLFAIFKIKFLYTRKELLIELRNPILIHFVGMSFERPWYKHSASPFNKEYNKYFRNSPWKNIEKKKIIFPTIIIYRYYDYISWILKRLNLYNTSLIFRTVIGQKIKKIIKIRR